MRIIPTSGFLRVGMLANSTKPLLDVSLQKLEVSLLGDVIEVEWIDIRLVRKRRAMPDDDVIPAGA
jgi:hypothetical protein